MNKDELLKKRDEFLEKYYNEQCEMGELNFRHMDTPDQACIVGFDYACSLLEPEIERLHEVIITLQRERYPQQFVDKLGAQLEHANRRIEKLRVALNKYANEETHSMDKNGEVWYGDYFDYDTAKEALAEDDKLAGGES